MWRAFFLAMGISLFLVGAECLVVEQATLVKKVQAADPGGILAQASPTPVVVRPPEWVPWTFMSAGAVVVLYSFTIPRRVAA
jgi:hypothetical protein